MLHCFYEIADNDFIDCILKESMFPNKDLYSIDEFPFSHF